MFRRLFALEIEALRQQFDDVRDRIAVRDREVEDGVAAPVRSFFGLSRDGGSAPGIWTLRRPV